MTTNKTTNRNRRTFNPETDKVRLHLVHVKIFGRDKCEGMDTDMGPKMVLNTQLAVLDAIKAWRNEYNVPVNHDHRPLTRIMVREVKGDAAIGTGAMTQAEQDRQEELAEQERLDRMYEDDNSDDMEVLIEQAINATLDEVLV